MNTYFDREDFDKDAIYCSKCDNNYTIQCMTCRTPCDGNGNPIGRPSDFVEKGIVKKITACDIPAPDGFWQQGWVCPKCGRGLSPWTDYCPCVGEDMKITYSTGTNENFDIQEYIKQIKNYNVEQNED